MRMRRFLLFPLALSLLAVALVGCFTPHAITQGEWFRPQGAGSHQFRRIAILGFENAPLFQQGLTIAYLNRGIDVVEREKVIEIVREQQLINANFADLSDKDKAVALGRLLDVDALVMGGVVHRRYSALSGSQVKGARRFGLQFGGSAMQNPIPKSLVNAEFGASYRAIDVSTGEIICVGNRILSLRQKAKRKNLNQLSQLELIRLMCNEIVEDSLTAESNTRDFAIDF